MKKNYINLLIIVIFILLTFSACKSENENFEHIDDLLLLQLDWKADDYLYSLKEDQEDVITIKSIHYGAFSGKDEDELLVLYHISAPHVGGLDRTIAAIYNKDTLNIITQTTLIADRVSVYILPSENGENYILYIGNTIYQGISAYSIKTISNSR